MGPECFSEQLLSLVQAKDFGIYFVKTLPYQKKSKLAKKGSKKKKKIVKWIKKYEQLLNWSSWNFIRVRVNVFFLSIIITETKVWYNYHIFNSWYLFLWFLYLSSGSACFDTCYLTRSDTIKISFKNDSNNKFCELEATQNIIF